MTQSPLTGLYLIQLGAGQYITAKLALSPDDPLFKYDADLRKIVPVPKGEDKHYEKTLHTDAGTR